MKNSKYKNEILRRLSYTNRFFLIGLYGIATILQLIAFLVVNQLEVDGLYKIIPGIFALTSGLVTIASFFTNPRFKYSIVIHAAYLFFSVLFGILTTVFFAIDYQYVSMSGLAFALFLTSQLSIIGGGVLFFFTLNHDRAKLPKLPLIFAVTLPIVGSILYGWSLLNYGYFGQGRTGRVINYHENEDGGYTAVSLIKGLGKDITIPSTFNNKPITQISYELFNDECITKVTIEPRSLLSFTNPNAFNNTKHIDINIPKEFASKFKEDCYKNSLAYNNTHLASLGNSVIPTHYEDDEYYITFNYDGTMDKATNEGTLYYEPIIYLKKNSLITKESFDASYLIHSNPNIEEDLYARYLDNKYIVTTFNYKDGTPIIGSNINSNINATIHFDYIYDFTFAKGNDTKYNAPIEDTSIIIEDVIMLEKKLSISKNAYDLFTNYSRREGFDLDFYLGDIDKERLDNKTQLESYLFTHKSVYINPIWALQNPQVNVAYKDTITYGEDVIFSTEVNHVIKEGISYQYRWRHNNVQIGNNDTLTLVKEVPNNSGEYVLEVTTSYENSSLVANIEPIVSHLTINKKSIEYKKSSETPFNLTYDGNEHEFIICLDEDAIVDDSDLIYASFSYLETNASNYEFNFYNQLSKDFLDKYELKNTANYFNATINKRVINLTVNQDKIITYDGNDYSNIVFDEDYIVTNIVEGEIFTDIYDVSPAAIYHNAGKYTFDVVVTSKIDKITEANNYSISKTSGQITINPKAATLIWEDKVYTYTGQLQFNKVNDIDGVVSNDNKSILINLISYDTSDPELINAGDNKHVTSNVSNLKNYVFEEDNITNYFNIAKLDIGSNKVTYGATPSSVYTGSEIKNKPNNITIKASGIDINYDDLIFTNYANNIDVGGVATYDIEAKENTNYVGTKVGLYFEIYKANPTYTAPSANSLTYNESAQTLVTTGSTTHGTIYYSSNGSSWSTIRPTATNAGSYTVYWKLIGDSNHNDVDSTSIAVTISSKSITPAINLSDDSYKYDGNSHTPTVTVKDGSTTLTSGTDYTLSYSNSITSSDNRTTAGTITVTATLKGNYSGSNTATYVINKANISPTVTMTGWTYGNTASNPSVSGNPGGVVTYHYKVQGADDSTYVTTKPSNAGDYTVRATIAATTNYNGATATANFTIAKATPVVTAPTAKTGLAYTGSAQALVNAGSTTGGTLKYSLTSGSGYSTSIPTATNAGNYTVYYKVDGNTNYNSVAASSIAVTISSKSITPAINLSDDSYTYDGNSHTPTVTVKDSTTTLTDGTDYDLTYSNSTTSSDNRTTAGTITVTATLKGNYSGSNTATYVINKANPTYTAPTGKVDIIYDGNEQELLSSLGSSVTDTTMKYRIGTSGSYSSSMPVASEVGEYDIYFMIEGGTNYNNLVIDTPIHVNIVMED